MIFRVFGVLAALFLLSLQAVATPVIDYQLVGLGTQTGGNPNYQYTYSLFNDGSLPAAAPIQLFDIDFPTASYANITAVSPAPSGWTDQILNPVGAGPYDFDASTSGGGITVGNSLGGFVVDFTWLGQGLPGPQTFEISNPINFVVYTPNGTGTTVYVSPEPATFGMSAILFAYCAWQFRRKRTQSTLDQG